MLNIEDLYSWARYFHGQVNRRYYFCGSENANLWNDGKLTEEERKIGLTKLPSGDEGEWEDCIFPDEEIVIEVAKHWGVDPCLEKYKDSKSKRTRKELVLFMR